MPLSKQTYSNKSAAREFVFNTPLGAKLVALIHKKGNAGITTTELAQALGYAGTGGANSLLRMLKTAGFVDKKKINRGRIKPYILNEAKFMAFLKSESGELFAALPSQLFEPGEHFPAFLVLMFGEDHSKETTDSFMRMLDNYDFEKGNWRLRDFALIAAMKSWRKLS